MTATAVACLALETKAGCCVLINGVSTRSCVLTCPDPPACPVWDIEGQFKVIQWLEKYNFTNESTTTLLDWGVQDKMLAIITQLNAV
uniref:Uncharacterized protein n=1 Tax=Romanomermis culicivorax TaxID=13658 RepID=A0A915J571_ROMCU